MPFEPNRQRYDPGLSNIFETPDASPVDTYVQPAPTPGQQLAKALSQIQPSIGRFNDTLATDYIQKQRDQGAQSAREAAEQARQAGDFSRAGKLPLQANPYFMSAYEEELGRVSAGQWESDFKAQANADPKLQNSTDLNDFDKAVGSSVAGWMQTNGIQRTAEFERGFGNMKDQYVAMARLQFANGIEKKLKTNSGEAQFALTKRAIQDNYGRPNVTLDQIAGDIDSLAHAQVLRGIPESQARQVAARAIQAAALDQDDPETGKVILKGLLSKVQGEGGQGTLQDQSYGSKILEDTTSELIQSGHQKLVYQQQAADQQQKAQLNTVITDASAAIQKAPNMNVALWWKRNQQNYPGFKSPDVINQLAQLQSEWRGSYNTSVPSVYNGLVEDIYAPSKGEPEITAQDVINRARNHQLNGNDANELIGMIQRRDADAGSSSVDPLDKLAKPYIDDERQYMEHRFVSLFGSIAGGVDAERVRNAKAMLRSQWANLKASGAASSMKPDQLNGWFIQATDGILNAQQQGGTNFSPGYVPPPQLGSKDSFESGVTAQTGTTGSTKKPEQPELPTTPVLQMHDFKDSQAIADAMVKFHIPPNQRKAFLLQQLKMLMPKPTKAAGQ